MGEPVERFGIRNAFDLRPVSSFVSELRFRQAMLQVPVIGQEQEPFAVAIEASDRVDVEDRDVFFQSPLAGMVFGELAQNIEWLVEQDVPVGQG